MNDLIKRLLRKTHDHVSQQVPWLVNPDGPEAADRLTAMKAAGDGLRWFVGHTRICAANMFMDEGCTCGLTDAIKQWKEASDGL